MTKFFLSVFITVLYLKIYSAQYYVYQPEYQQYVTPNLQNTAVVYGPTRNNAPTRLNSNNQQTKRGNQNNNQQNNYPGENYNDAAKGLGQYDPPLNTRQHNNAGQRINNQNTGNPNGQVTNSQTWQNSNQHTGVINSQVPNTQTWNNQNQNQHTGSEPNPDDNIEPYSFLGKQDPENTSQSTTVQLRYNSRRYPNPYRQNSQPNQQNSNNQFGSINPNQNSYKQGNNIVVTNNPYCTQIAKQLIEKGGNVREVFIATSLCEGFVHPMDSGLGGGFLAVYYNFENNHPNTVFIDSREKSPSSSKFTRSPTKTGGNSIAIPSVLAGYEAIYNIDKHKNRLQWSEIIKPVFDLCQNGYYMSKTTKRMIELLIGNFNRTQTNNNILKIPKFCDTLAQIGLDGPVSSMYREKGNLHKLLVQDLRGVKSSITSRDIQNNRARISQPAVTQFDHYTVYSTKSPGSGQAMLFALKIINRLRQIIPPTTTNDEKIVYLLKILKYTYTLQPHLNEISEDKINKIVNEASQSLAEGIVKGGFKLKNTIPTKFGDVTLPKLQSATSEGTTNIVIKIGKSAISASSSINSLFGSGIFSETMGFFYNNHLRDFSGSNWRRNGKPLKNVAGPNKVPTSSISPIIMVDSQTGEPVFQIGSAGGSHILSAMINTCFNYFIMNLSLRDSVAGCRIMPKFNYKRNKVTYLYECADFQQSASRLRKIGVDLTYSETAGFAAVTALSKLRGGQTEAVFDNRRGGSFMI